MPDEPDSQRIIRGNPHQHDAAARSAAGDTLARAIAGLALALAAPALGGGAAPWEQAAIVTGIGCVAVMLPARRVSPIYLLLAAVALVAALGWALPAAWLPAPWRDRLVAAGIDAGVLNSPEPWASARAWLLLLAGLVWASWVSGHDWPRRERRLVCEGLAMGIGAIALAAVAMRGRHVPGWPAGTGLGPFANRNQSATLYAIGAFLSIACAADRLRKHAGRSPGRRAVWGLGWAAVLAIHAAALALDHSRSGPLLLAGMTLSWGAMAAPRWKRRAESLAIGAAVALLLGAIFLVMGPGLVGRLASTRLFDFRLRIYQDALVLIRASPLAGTGLGCFEPIFPLYRVASVVQERVLHPESDWFWLTAEMGLAGLAAMAALVVWMARRACVALGGESRGLRLALAVACAGVLAHSLGDVPGHRLGTVMPALLLLGVVVGGQGTSSLPAGVGLRLAGVAVLMTGGAALAVLTMGFASPLVNGPAVLEAQAREAFDAGDPQDASALLDRAIGWAPVDWRFRSERARAEGASGRLTAALRDFRIARLLEPDYAQLPYEEGLYWMDREPAFAIEPWTDALRRSDRPAELYQAMLAHAYGAHAELRPALWSLAAGAPASQVAYLAWAGPGDFQPALDQVLKSDPGLVRFNPGQQGAILDLWRAKGDATRLAAQFDTHPEWLAAGYGALARLRASRGDVAGAVGLVLRYLPPPRLPASQGISPAEAGRRFSHDARDFAAGLALYDRAMALGRKKEALGILGEMVGMPGCPAYIYYLEGSLLAGNAEPAAAWLALGKYAEAAPR